MANEVYNLAILLSLKDMASGNLDRFQAKLIATGKDGEKFVKTYQQVRAEMQKGLAMGGIGVSGLALMSKGVLIAGDYQASVTELRAAFSQLRKDGTVDIAALGRDMQRAEVVAMRLGNQLPGTTEDFVQMMQVMRQNALDIETILNGGAEAVGNLAVATKSVPREIAGDVAKYGNLFKLKASEFIPAADVFSRIYTSTGQTTAELIEAAKYFQGRAGQNLGISGLKDAEMITRLFGFMGKQGMSGSMAGMGLTNFFESYNQHRDKLDDLSKATGIKLDFFDKAGKFVGMEKVIEQMQQFNKLTDKDRTAWMSEIFGTLGMGAGNILANGKAWEAFNVEQQKTIGLQAKNAEISKNFNNQVEALTGSLKNLVVTGFGPLLPGLTSAAEKTNAMVGAVQEFAKANPTLTTFLAKFALIGSTALAVGGGLKFVVSGIRMLSFASKFSSEERVTNFLSKLKQNAEAATPAVNKAGDAVVATEKKVTASAGRLSKISNSPITFTLQMVAAGMTIEHFLSVLSEVADRTAKINENGRAANAEYDSLMGQMKLWGSPGQYGGKNASIGEVDKLVAPMVDVMKMGRSLEFALAPDRAGTFEHFWTSQRPYASPWSTKPGDRFGMPFDPSIAVENWKRAGITTQMQDPNVLARLIPKLQEDLRVSPESNQALIRALEMATSKEKVDTALKIAKGQSLQQQQPGPVLPSPFSGQPYNPFGSINGLPTGGLNLQKPIIDLSTGFMQLQPSLTTTTQGFDALQGPVKDLPAGFQRIRGSADGLSSALDTVSSRLSSWTPPASGTSFATGPDGQPIAVPSNAVGGHIERDGFAFVHRGNTIVPAKKRAYEGSEGMTVNYSPQITINGGGANARAEFAAMLYDHKRDIEEIVAGRMKRGRARA